MKLRIGDKVRFLNEVGEGVVSRIKDNKTVFVEMPDGFEIPYSANQLVPIHTELILDKDTENIELDPGARINDAVYFVIEPDQELPQLISDYKIYLFNSSSFNLMYAYSIRDEEYFQTIKHGEAGPFQKVLLRQVKLPFFNEFPYHRIEGIFYRHSHFKAQPPLNQVLHVSPNILNRFDRIVHEEFRFPVYGFLLRDEFAQTEKVEHQLSLVDLAKLKALKEFKTSHAKSKSSKEYLKSLEKTIDLHISELVENTQGLSSHELLHIQLERFEKELDTAIQGSIKKIIFIHGVGNGRLRQEIHSILRQTQGITFHDAPYKDFGFGATQVNIL